jgi:hypothetical protein
MRTHSPATAAPSLLRQLINEGLRMSRNKKLLHICFLFAFIYMMMCPVVHALHDRYIGNAVFNFPLHSTVQKYTAGDAKHHQDEVVYSAPADYHPIISGSAQSIPRPVLINSANNLSIVSTTRLNL